MKYPDVAKTGQERENSMLKAKNIMSTEVVSVTKETPIYEAMALLINNEITGMPVIDDDMNLVGVITEKDCLRLFYDEEDEKDKTVRHFMTCPAVHYNENDSLETICNFMMINYFRRVPVTSKKGKVVGILSRPDVIKHILNKRRSE